MLDDWLTYKSELQLFDDQFKSNKPNHMCLTVYALQHLTREKVKQVIFNYKKHIY